MRLAEAEAEVEESEVEVVVEVVVVGEKLCGGMFMSVVGKVAGALADVVDVVVAGSVWGDAAGGVSGC